jgi:hypothetical protein
MTTQTRGLQPLGGAMHQIRSIRGITPAWVPSGEFPWRGGWLLPPLQVTAASCTAIRCPEPGNHYPPPRALIQRTLPQNGSSDAHDPYIGVNEQIIDMPPQALCSGQVAANPVVHVATGTSGVNVVARRKTEPPEPTDGDGLSVRHTDAELIRD